MFLAFATADFIDVIEPTTISILVRTRQDSPSMPEWPEGFLAKPTFKLKERKRMGSVVLRASDDAPSTVNHQKRKSGEAFGEDTDDNKDEEMASLEEEEGGRWGRVEGALRGFVIR